MEVTVAVIIAMVTLIAGEITKITTIPNKYIPLQNLLIACISIAICLIFKVQDMSILETIITCVFGSMSAGGIADIKKVTKSE